MDPTFLIVLGLIAVVVIYVIVKRRQPAAAAPAAAPVAVAAAPQQVRPGAGAEVIAAISAAVAVYMESEAPGVPYAITSVKPSAAVRNPIGAGRATRPVWGFAGMRQNTEPF